MFGYDFHRQKPLLNFIVDFYCYELNLVIEIDGQYHNYEDKFAADNLRDKELETYGLTIMRFTEREVRKDMAYVLRVLEQYILERN
jgi:very-short-patch-repair endonuclease